MRFVPNAVTLHYDKNRRRIEAGELVVQDVGAEFGYYSADITRTSRPRAALPRASGRCISWFSRPNRRPSTRSGREPV
jgi:hypothetical protein